MTRQHASRMKAVAIVRLHSKQNDGALLGTPRQCLVATRQAEGRAIDRMRDHQRVDAEDGADQLRRQQIGRPTSSMDTAASDRNDVIGILGGMIEIVDDASNGTEPSARQFVSSSRIDTDFYDMRVRLEEGCSEFGRAFQRVSHIFQRTLQLFP